MKVSYSAQTKRYYITLTEAEYRNLATALFEFTVTAENGMAWEAELKLAKRLQALAFEARQDPTEDV
jgi:hypothetical protein